MADKNLLQMPRSMGEFGVVCQEQTWHSMLRAVGLPRRRTSGLAWSAVNERGRKPEIC